MLFTTKTLLALTVLVSSILVTDAFAQQPITLDQLNHIPESDLDSLADLGADMTLDEFEYLILPQDLLGETVKFTAVVATDPFSSGRATVNNDRVDRIHVMIVDTTANSALGKRAADHVSYWSQLVDGNYEDTGTLDLLPGDVINVTGIVGLFNAVIQIAPVSFQVIGTMADRGISESILDPLVIESGDVTNAVEGGSQGNVREWPRIGNRYVTLENARVENRIIENSGQPHMLITTDDGETTVEFSNTSIVFRNDKTRTYPDEFNHRGEVWVPPPPGSIVNYSGYVLASGDCRLSTCVPTFAGFNVEPFEISDIERKRRFV